MAKRKQSLMATLEAAIEDEVRRRVDVVVTKIMNGLAKEGWSKTKRKRSTRDMRCINPTCKARSRGPRFRYLCIKHSATNPQLIKAWAAAKARRAK